MKRRTFVGRLAATVAGAVGATGMATAAKDYDYLDPVFATDPLSVYDSVGHDRQAVVSPRTGGRVFQGPERHDGRNWWYVQFAGDGADPPVTGWVLEYGLSIADFACPLTGTVTSTYWDYRDGGTRRHRAVDISSGPSGGGYVLAARDGRVRVPPYDYGGYGNWVILEHDDGWETWYGHLRRIDVDPGEYVSRGDRIAIEGATGVGGAHLDFSVHGPGGGEYRSFYDRGERTIAGTGVPRAFF